MVGASLLPEEDEHADRTPDGRPWSLPLPGTVNGDTVRALRQAREIAEDMRWRGMPVPPLYAHMAEEFRTLVRSGDYDAWVVTAHVPDKSPEQAPWLLKAGVKV